MNLPERPLSSNFTTPSINAKSVSSLPRPTLFPGFHLVPRCRAMMLPPSTRSPPNFLSPNRCACESRPFRDEPTPFLCAITNSVLGSLCFVLCPLSYRSAITRPVPKSNKAQRRSTNGQKSTNRIYLQSRETLAMAAGTLVLFASLLLKQHDLLILTVFNYGDLDLLVSGSEQRLELNRATRFGFH